LEKDRAESLKGKERENTLGNQAAMDLLSISVGCKEKSMLEENVEHSFWDSGAYRQASEGSCFQNKELSGDGLKRCCGGRASRILRHH
jgi:hypothetical protein